jgi:hypothetical protein
VQEVTKSNVIEHIIEMGRILDEANVPTDKRYIYLPWDAPRSHKKRIIKKRMKAMLFNIK